MKKLYSLIIALVGTLTVYAEGEQPTITAWRSSVNTNDATDFASLYVSDEGATIKEDSEYETGTISYLWEKSSDGGNTWATYSDGLGEATNNIRPIRGGQYRCTVTLTHADKTTVRVISNAITVTTTTGSTVTISSNIPVISIRTDKADLPAIANVTNAPLTSNKDMFEAKAKRSADCKIIWNGKTADGSSAIYDGSMFDKASGMLYYDKKIRISYRGSSSMSKSRRNYAFVVGEDNCKNGQWVKGKEKMFKLSDKKDKDWILYASFDDATFMRNNVQLSLYEQMTGHWNSHCRYVKVYINGEDKGLYVFMEKNKDGSARIDVDDDGFIFKYDKTDMVDRFENPESITLADGSKVEQTKSTFISKNSGQEGVGTYGLTIDHGWEVVFPAYDDFTSAEWDAKIATLKGKIDAFETAIKENNYLTARTLVDYESFADYFIIQELAKNVDGYRISQFFKYKNSTSKLMAEPLWDTELGLGGHNSSVNNNSLLLEEGFPYTDDFPIPFWWTGYTGGGQTGRSGTDNTGYNNRKRSIGSSNGLLGDACFKAKIKQRWALHTAEGGPLTEANFTKLITPMETSSGKSSSAFSGWLYGNDSRVKKLGAIINGWSIDPYVTSITSDFADGEGVTEEDNIKTKSVESETEITLNASATAAGGATLYYSWQYSADGETNWITVVDDSESPEYTFTVTEPGYYRAKAKSAECDCMKYDSNNVLQIKLSDVIVSCK